MEELVTTSRVAGYIEKIYRQLNTDKFNGELEQPIITIMSTPKAYGHVTCGKVWRVKDTRRYELNIGAGKLDRPIESVVSTILHEMVHIYHLMHDIQDTSRGNTYHNKQFKQKAEEVGLIIEYDKKIGWSIISPSEALIDYIVTQGWNDILINRQESTRVGIDGKDHTNGAQDEDTEKKPSSTRKYICPHCSTSVRATRTVAIKCIPCDTQMIVEEKEK